MSRERVGASKVTGKGHQEMEYLNNLLGMDTCIVSKNDNRMCACVHVCQRASVYVCVCFHKAKMHTTPSRLFHHTAHTRARLISCVGGATTPPHTHTHFTPSVCVCVRVCVCVCTQVLCV